MRGNFGNMMKQAQAMQANMQKVQAEIANIEVSGESGGGMVKVLMTGKHEVKRVQIEPAVAGEDREMLEDLIAAAINDANQITGQAYLSANTKAHAFLWANGKMKDIDTLGSTYSEGESINQSGAVVGRMTVSSPSLYLVYHAFVFRSGKMQDLNKLIPKSSGWVLEEASGINDAGQIVGVGTLHGQDHGFLLQPSSQ